MDAKSYYAALADAIVAFHYRGMSASSSSVERCSSADSAFRGCCRWRWVPTRGSVRFHLLCIGDVSRRLRPHNCDHLLPLTNWERDLRVLSGQSVNDSVIGWFFNSILFFNWPREYFTWIHISFGALVLGTFLLGPPRFRRRKAVESASFNGADMLVKEDDGLQNPALKASP